MKVLLLDAPQSMLDERRRLGLDGRDEMWDGVLHMVPPPGGPHQRLSTDLMLTLGSLARARGLVPHMETGLFAQARNFRVPDQLYSRSDDLSDRGVEGADLVVEIRSPGDETYDKIPFYAACGVREMLIVHPADRRFELLRLADGELRPVDDKRSEVLDLDPATVEGRLRITWAGGSAEV